MADPVNLGTFTTASHAVGTAAQLSKGAYQHGWQIVCTTVDSLSVTLEGSLDGTNFVTLDTYTGTSTTLRFVTDKPVMFVRANPGTLTGATASITVLYLGAL